MKRASDPAFQNTKRCNRLVRMPADWSAASCSMPMHLPPASDYFERSEDAGLMTMPRFA
jgi:hypothetical protein